MVFKNNCYHSYFTHKTGFLGLSRSFVSIGKIVRPLVFGRSSVCLRSI
jgi:hypothetical protein